MFLYYYNYNIIHMWIHFTDLLVVPQGIKDMKTYEDENQSIHIDHAQDMFLTATKIYIVDLQTFRQDVDRLINKFIGFEIYSL